MGKKKRKMNNHPACPGGWGGYYGEGSYPPDYTGPILYQPQHYYNDYGGSIPPYGRDDDDPSQLPQLMDYHNNQAHQLPYSNPSHLQQGPLHSSPLDHLPAEEPSFILRDPRNHIYNHVPITVPYPEYSRDVDNYSGSDVPLADNGIQKNPPQSQHNNIPIHVTDISSGHIEIGPYNPTLPTYNDSPFHSTGPSHSTTTSVKMLKPIFNRGANNVTLTPMMKPETTPPPSKMEELSVPLVPKVEIITGFVTQIQEAFGMVSGEIFFHNSAVVGSLPKIGDKVVVEAEPVNGMPFKFNAKKVQMLSRDLTEKTIQKERSDLDSITLPDPVSSMQSVDPLPVLLRSILKKTPPPPPVLSKSKTKGRAKTFVYQDVLDNKCKVQPAESPVGFDDAAFYVGHGNVFPVLKLPDNLHELTNQDEYESEVSNTLEQLHPVITDKLPDNNYGNMSPASTAEHKKYRNYMARQRKKSKQLMTDIKNKQLHQQGLPVPPVRRGINHGLKWRQRGANRKIIGLPVGPTTYRVSTVFSDTLS